MKKVKNVMLMLLFTILIFMITGCGPPAPSYSSSHSHSSDMSECNDIVRENPSPKIDGQHNVDMNYNKDEPGSMEKSDDNMHGEKGNKGNEIDNSSRPPTRDEIVDCLKRTSAAILKIEAFLIVQSTKGERE